jgi:osmoprotectant transport system ATP-binding protein
MTVERNAGMALELGGVGRVNTGNSRSLQDDNKGTDNSRAVNGQARVSEVLGLVGMDATEFRGRYPWQLSGGQRQRVGLTRADMQTMLRGLLGRLGKTVLLVTHDLDEALYLAGRVVFLEHGEVVADLAAGEVLGSENAKVQEYVRAVRRSS